MVAALILLLLPMVGRYLGPLRVTLPELDLLFTAAAGAAVGFFGIAGPGAGAASAAAIAPTAAGLVGAASLFAAYLAVGPWCRGLRAAGQAVGAAPLLPSRPSAVLGRHLVAPTCLGVVVSAGCAGLAAGASAGSVPPAMLAGALLGLVSVALRLLGALKGPLPQRLLAPVPTPAGDMSGVNVVLWNLDGPIWALLLGAGLAAVVAGSSAWAALLTLAALGALLLWSAARLRGTDFS